VEWSRPGWATLSTNEILAGLGLTVGCQSAAARGFIAGAITDDVNPTRLFGSAFQPLVSLSEGLILFAAGPRSRRSGWGPLFALRADGDFRVIEAGAGPGVGTGERVICLTSDAATRTGS
jgi:hypothetical protein